MKKEDKSRLSLIKFWQFFNHISATRQKFKNLVSNFININMKSLKTEGGDRGWQMDVL